MTGKPLQFDERTGQVHTETSIPVRSMVPAWLTTHTGKKVDPSKYRKRGIGASSLHDMALRSCAWNIDLFEPSVLMEIEWPYAEKIYKNLKQIDAVNLKTWALFQKASPNHACAELDHIFHLRIAAQHPGRVIPPETNAHPLELIPINKFIISLPSEILTHLELRALVIRDTEMIQILDMPGLSCLILEQNPSLTSIWDDDGGVCDGFMGRWARAARDKKALPRLKVLAFRRFQTSLRPTLNSFLAFPQLELVHVETFAVKTDMLGLEHGALVERQWRHLVTEGPDALPAEKNPEDIQNRPYTNTHEKMNMLYNLTSKQDVPSHQHVQDTAATSGSPILSIKYYAYTRAWDPSGPSPWFVRVPASSLEEDGVSLPVKRSAVEPEVTGLTARKRQPLKKKVKKGKQQDIGALLGTFG